MAMEGRWITPHPVVITPLPAAFLRLPFAVHNEDSDPVPIQKHPDA